MNEQNGRMQNISLIIGLTIPLAMILFIAIAINGPRWFNAVEPPAYDFLYTTGRRNAYTAFLVKDARLILEKSTMPEGVNVPQTLTTHFFIHKVAENTSREISEDEAMNLALDPDLRSPDGFSIERGRRVSWFIFGHSRNNNNRYLMKENYSQKFEWETRSSNYNYSRSFRFVGWIGSNE